MITKFTKNINSLTFLGDGIDNDQKMRKAIHALPENTPRGEVNRCMTNLMTNDVELKT